ncbi:MAG: MBL fold metallo-hydrolase [Thermoanaerobaculia bacterium]|nr:MBL fold metallo-hydrolase [Thermoanaerobaculia bacterium]
MLLERFEDTGLSQYSYAVGCEGTGKVAIVDPRRDVDIYLDWAKREGMSITHVLETHIHADFASGAQELANRVGAELLLSAYDEGELYEVSFDHTDLHQGDSITLGKVQIEALHTPGHTPEHLSFLVFDGARSVSTPIAMLSGDFLFVGSLGRPDLLGEEAKIALARRMFNSVHERLSGLPDGLEILPGHGAGSMCGAGMSGRPHSTLGFERIANPYLDPKLTEEQFVERILTDVPPLPPYYRRMKELNAAGPRTLDGIPGLDALSIVDFAHQRDVGATVIDLRDQLSFGGGHIPAASGIGAWGSISTWAAWTVSYDNPIVLVGEDIASIEAGARGLIRVGLDRIEGHLGDGMEAWIESGQPIEVLEQISPQDLHQRLASGDGPHVLDIRSDSEWASGHVDGAQHLMGGWIEERLAELPPPEEELAVVCAGGYRSTVVASVLARHGYQRLLNVTGGMNAWKRSSLPVA